MKREPEEVEALWHVGSRKEERPVIDGCVVMVLALIVGTIAAITHIIVFYL